VFWKNLKVLDLDFKIGRWLLIHRSLVKQLFLEASVSNGMRTTMHFELINYYAATACIGLSDNHKE
jgi:hypothetical protein